MASLGLLSANVGWALPTLQLDIAPGVYNTSDGTTYATSPQFTVLALYNHSVVLPTPFYLSAAIAPMQANLTPPPDIGKFTIRSPDGTTYPEKTYTESDLKWGDPPVNVIDNANGTGPNNLPPHAIFPTYYLEIPFYFDSSKQLGAYNTQTGDPSPPGILYYQDFVVDVSGLLPGLSVHFDLFDEAIKIFKKGGTKYLVDDFAPFSHDAQSGPPPVPDAGATAGLLGLGMLMVRLLRRQNERN